MGKLSLQKMAQKAAARRRDIAMASARRKEIFGDDDFDSVTPRSSASLLPPHMRTSGGARSQQDQNQASRRREMFGDPEVTPRSSASLLPPHMPVSVTGDSAIWCNKQPTARRNDIFGDPEEFRERSESALPPHLRSTGTGQSAEEQKREARRNEIFGDPEEFRERSESALPPQLRIHQTDCSVEDSRAEALSARAAVAQELTDNPRLQAVRAMPHIEYHEGLSFPVCPAYLAQQKKKQAESSQDVSSLNPRAQYPAPVHFLDVNAAAKIFKQFDRNENGQLDANEMLLLLVHLYTSMGKGWIAKYSERMHREVASAISMFDQDGDGEINFSEFQNMIGEKPWCTLLPLSRPAGTFNQCVESLFSEADSDGDGYLDPHELYRVVTLLFKMMGKTWLEPYHDRVKHEVQLAVAKFDTNKDGVLSLGEFVHMLKSKPWSVLVPPEEVDGSLTAVSAEDSCEGFAVRRVTADEGYLLERTSRDPGTNLQPRKPRVDVQPHFEANYNCDWRGMLPLEPEVRQHATCGRDLAIRQAGWRS